MTSAIQTLPDALLLGQDIAVLIPCFNEEASIEQVVSDFRKTLPTARIYVYDNNSKDATAAVARRAGAIVRTEPLQGKGNVVRRMFADIEADIYVMVDGDDTYDASAASDMVRLLASERLDFVNGKRIIPDGYRAGHKFGNRMLTGAVSFIFGSRLDDMLSGLKIFSRRFVKSFPCLTSGFELETELTIHALELKMSLAEHPVHYRDRKPGSESKLNTFRDGFRILLTIFRLLRAERPMLFFGTICCLLALAGLVLFVPIFVEYEHTGLVPRFPTAILVTGLMILASLSAICGFIVETVTLGRREQKRMIYLSIPPPADVISGVGR